MNKSTKNRNFCPICGGIKKAGKTTYTVDPGFGVIVVRDVPAIICSQCGEEWIADTTAKSLEKIVNEARKKKMQFEVLTLK